MTQRVLISSDAVRLEGNLAIPKDALGIVLASFPGGWLRMLHLIQLGEPIERPPLLARHGAGDRSVIRWLS